MPSPLPLCRVLWLAALLIVPRAALSDVPSRLSYQGILTNANGTVVADGSYSLRFRVYDNAAGTAPILFEQTLSVAIEDGIYNVILSDNSGFTLADAFSSSPRFMEVALVQSPTNVVVMLPRQEIASVPFALTAARAVEISTPPANPLPVGAIILWQDTAACPPGFAELGEFRNLTIRGADTIADRPAIPDVPGRTCDGAGVVDPGCGTGTQTTPYDDLIQVDELATHRHQLVDRSSSAGGGDDPNSFDIGVSDGGSQDAADTTDAGGDDPHFHPFRTVLFCRRL